MCVCVICSIWKSESFHSILYLVKCLFSLSHSSTFQMLNVSSLRDFKRLIKMRVVIALTFHNLTHRHQWASLNVEKQCLVYRFFTARKHWKGRKNEEYNIHSNQIHYYHSLHVFDATKKPKANIFAIGTFAQR